MTRLQIRPSLQLLLICSLLWLSLVWYEVLIMLLPVFPIIYLGGCLLEKRLPRPSEWSLAFVPALPVLIHVLILAGAKNPVWTRAKPDVDYYSLPLQEKVILGFKNALNQSFGQQHFDQLTHGVDAFFRHVVPANPGILSPFIVTISNKEGTPVEELTFPSMDNARADRLISARHRTTTRQLDSVHRTAAVGARGPNVAQ